MISENGRSNGSNSIRTPLLCLGNQRALEGPGLRDLVGFRTAPIAFAVDGEVVPVNVTVFTPIECQCDYPPVLPARMECAC